MAVFVRLHPQLALTVPVPGWHYRDKPLAFYVFTKDKATETLLLANTTAGGVTVNDTLFHIGGRHSWDTLGTLL